MVWWVLVACVARRTGVEADPIEAPLVAADALWALRAEPEGLPRALAAYEALLGVSSDPRVLARVARAHHRVALVAPTPSEAIGSYETSREVGERCLAEAPDVAPSLGGSGWVWTATVLARVDAGRAPCLTWALAATVGGVEARGRGAMLALEPVAALAERALALTPDDPWVLRSAALLVLLDPRADATARTTATAQLARAADAEPGLLLFAADLAAAEGRAYVPPPPEPEDPFALENAWLRAREKRPAEGPLR